MKNKADDTLPDISPDEEVSDQVKTSLRRITPSMVRISLIIALYCWFRIIYTLINPELSSTARAADIAGTLLALSASFFLYLAGLNARRITKSGVGDVMFLKRFFRHMKFSAVFMLLLLLALFALEVLSIFNVNPLK